MDGGVAGFAVQMKRAGEREKKVCDTDRSCVSAMTHRCPVKAINWLTKTAICCRDKRALGDSFCVTGRL